MMFKLNDQLTLPSPVVKVESSLLSSKGINLYIKREDLIHPWVSGNKWRKLKYNLAYCIEHNFKGIITFGGAYSNHLYAVAGACHLLGIESVGIIRGEIDVNNPTLKFCMDKGMKLVSVARSEYRLKENSALISEILSTNQNYYLVPEGGTNDLALRGVTEICSEIENQIPTIPDIVVCSCGTGGTAAGLCLGQNKQSSILAISALKSNHLENEITQLLEGKPHLPFTVNTDYHWGGYAKYDEKLLNKISKLEQDWDIPLDHVYNGKALLGLLDMIEKDYFKQGSKILYIHTGGIQGKIV